MTLQDLYNQANSDYASFIAARDAVNAAANTSFAPAFFGGPLIPTGGSPDLTSASVSAFQKYGQSVAAYLAAGGTKDTTGQPLAPVILAGSSTGSNTIPVSIPNPLPPQAGQIPTTSSISSITSSPIFLIAGIGFAALLLFSTPKASSPRTKSKKH